MRSLLTINQRDLVKFPIFSCFMVLIFVGIFFFSHTTAMAQDCTTDAQLADDQPGQKDINEFCEGPGTSDFELDISFNFDDTRWTGNNTGDGCALFDTDNDTFANFALCVTIVDGNGQPAYQDPLSPKLYRCDGDDREDRCTSSVEITPFSSICSVNVGGSEASGEDEDPFAAEPSRKCSGTDCATQDAFVACSIEIDDVSLGESCDSGTCVNSGASCTIDGDCVPITDVCSYPSNQPNSDPSDCIVTPLPGDKCLDVDCSYLDDDCNLGACDPGTGECVLDPKPFSTPCEDGDNCTSLTGEPQTLDHCEFGVCTGIPVVCPQGETCDPADGQCKECTDDGDCDDVDVCNGTETCVAGACQPGTPLDCNDGNLCTTDTCDPETGCDNTPVVCPQGETCDPADGQCKECTDDGDCDDVDVCNGTETCVAGACQPGTPLDCNDGNLCTTDTCGPETGCDNTPVVCPQGETCDPADGQCKECTDDGDCDDVDVCNGTETCVAGACQPGTPLDCNDGNLCTTDTCDPETGCDNTPVVCPQGETCDPADGQCKECTDDGDCDDVDVCNGTETCVAGACQSGTPLDCNDGNLCTTDTCDPETGCVNTNNTAPCDDGSLCTVNDTCDNGVCSGLTKDCSSVDDQCNMGVCDSGTGNCVQDPTFYDGESCDDGNPSTVNDTCSNGVCRGNPVGAAIPTLSEWGMIIFITILLGFGVITILRRREE